MADALIVAARRTPIGTAGHALAQVTAAGLAAPVLSALAAEAAGPVSEVVLGNCTGPGGDLARYALLAAGLDESVPGLTVDRQCGSGLAAIELTARALPAEGVVLAGGVESASTAPVRSWPEDHPRAGERFDRAPFAPPELGDPEMGVANDLLAQSAGVTRARQDAYAARSHARAVAAIDAGRFDDEIVPVAGVRRDERPRAGLTEQRLARLRPAFRADGTATAGNSCGINDGAAAVAMVRASTAAPGTAGLRVLGAATAGVSPRTPGRGIVPAVRAALAQARVGLDDVDVVELNEAFAGQVLACCDELGLAEERVCPEGGALALGHPWGASGAVLVVRLFHQLMRPGARAEAIGLAGIAVGGGQGVALVVQACR